MKGLASSRALSGIGGEIAERPDGMASVGCDNAAAGDEGTASSVALIQPRHLNGFQDLFVRLLGVVGEIRQFLDPFP